MMSQSLLDRVRGVIYGQAIGDALGLGTEFLAKSEVKHYYPNGLTRYGAIVRDRHRRRWESGDWTDDTDQMLCIFDSLLEKQKVDVGDIAYRLHQWAAQDGMGIGYTVRTVLAAPDFLTHPHQAAERVWQNSGRVSAANGGVMRTSILGIWEYHSPDRVKHNAEQVCRITHSDPRCVGSCSIVCLTISALLQGQLDFNTLSQQAYQTAADTDERILDYLDKSQASLEALDLDEGLKPEAQEFGQIGYTLKALGAGLWALKAASSFMDGILSVIHEGGDADTNAAVAGALLGARFGFSEIPARLVEGLIHRSDLESRIERLMSLL